MVAWFWFPLKSICRFPLKSTSWFPLESTYRFPLESTYVLSLSNILIIFLYRESIKRVSCTGIDIFVGGHCLIDVLWPIRLIPKSLGFIRQIWLSMSGIRLVILLSLGETKNLLMALTWSKISSIVYSVWSFLHSILYKDYTIIAHLSILTYTP